MYVGNCLVSQGSGKHKAVSRFLTELEIQALAHIVSKMEWIQYLVIELHITESQVPLVNCDNIIAR